MCIRDRYEGTFSTVWVQFTSPPHTSFSTMRTERCGGLVNWTHTVENVPSYKSIHGMDLMTACREHVESLGVAIEEVNEVEEVRLDGQPKEIRTSEGDSFTADVVIIATGRKPIPLPVDCLLYTSPPHRRIIRRRAVRP